MHFCLQMLEVNPDEDQIWIKTTEDRGRMRVSFREGHTSPPLCKTTACYSLRGRQDVILPIIS